jgi:hypothetical protein
MKDFKTKNGFFTGNVGIGTTDPASPLHVNSDSGINGLIKLKSSDIEASVVFEDNGSTDIVNIGCRNNDLKLRTDAGNITFFTDSEGTASERMRIDSDGNVGIGTTNPPIKLTVNGAGIDISALFLSSDAGSYISFMDNSTSDRSQVLIGAQGDDLSMHAGSEPRMHIKSNGNVGIGTTNPESSLHVMQSADANDGITLQQVNQSKKVNLRTNNLGQFIVDVNDATVEAMRIDSNGNVGIGATNPSAKTVIKSGVNSLPDSDISADTGTALRILGADAAAIDLGCTGRTNNGGVGQWIQSRHSENDSTYYNLLLNPLGGNVGIGTTSPTDKLHIYNNTTSNLYPTVENSTSGNAGWRMKNSNGDWVMIANSALRFYDVGQTAERMRIDSDGNVGIGTTSPDKKLEVAGSLTSGQAANTRSKVSLQPSNTINRSLDIYSDGVINSYNSNFPTVGSGGLQFQIGGSTHLSINDSGNVGIGTTNPTYKLHLTDSGARNVILTSSEGLTSDGYGGYISTVSKASGASAAHGLLIGCFRPSTSDDFVGMIRFHQRNLVKQHLWFDNSGQLRVSTNGAHIGSDHEDSTVIGTQTSDERLKNIEDNFEYGLDKVMQLKPIAYKLKEDESQVRKLGFGAQTTQAIVPEVVFKSSMCIDGYDQDPEDEHGQIPRSEDTTLGMEYVQLIPVLTKAIQEQQAIIEDLKSRIETLEQ